MASNRPVVFRLTRFNIEELDSDFISSVSQPSLLIYQKQLGEDQERKNIDSSFKLRDEFEGVELAPLPCYYMEQVKLLGSKQRIDLSEFVCQHKMLQPRYQDIYEVRSPDFEANLEAGEFKMLEKRKGLKPERSFFNTKSKALRHLLIGTTFLPKPIVDFVLEKVERSN